MLAEHPGPTGIVAKLADADVPLFSPLLAQAPVPIQVLPASRTASFSMRWAGERRLLRVEAVGDPFTPEQLSGVLSGDGASALPRPGTPVSRPAGESPGKPWVHLAPLLRSDFPDETIQMLSETGFLISYDGQGLVRVPELGDLAVDERFHPGILDCISVLKLDELEADVVAGGSFDLQAAKRLRVPEILVTLGDRGCDLYADEGMTHLPLAVPPASSSRSPEIPDSSGEAPAIQPEIPGPQSVGAGDVFVVAYVCERAQGTSPVDAARRAGEVVAERLRARLSRRHAWP